MAWALRIEQPGGRYHDTARGNERKAIYYCDTDCEHFLQLLAEATQQFGIRVHACVLMNNRCYAAVGKAVSRFERRLIRGKQLQSELTVVERQLSNGHAWATMKSKHPPVHLSK